MRSVQSKLHRKQPKAADYDSVDDAVVAKDELGTVEEENPSPEPEGVASGEEFGEGGLGTREHEVDVGETTSDAVRDGAG